MQIGVCINEWMKNIINGPYVVSVQSANSPWPLNSGLCISNPLIMFIPSPNPPSLALVRLSRYLVPVTSQFIMKWPSSSFGRISSAMPRSRSLFAARMGHFWGHRGNPGSDTSPFDLTPLPSDFHSAKSLITTIPWIWFWGSSEH